MNKGYKIYLDEKDGKPIIKREIDLDSMFQELKEYIKDMETRNEELRDKLNNYNKDKEIQRYQNELTNVRRNSLYILNNKEKELVNEFRKEHYKKCGKSSRIEYILNPTEIGTGIGIRCSRCGCKKDITDYKEW